MERCELIAAEDIKRFGFVSINSDGLAQNSIDEIFPIGQRTTGQSTIGKPIL